MNNKNYSKAITERIFAVILQGSFIFYTFVWLIFCLVSVFFCRVAEDSDPAPGWYTEQEYVQAYQGSFGFQFMILGFLFFAIIYFCGSAIPFYGILAFAIILLWLLIVLIYFVKAVFRYGIKHAFELFLLRIVLLKKNLELGIGKYRPFDGNLLKKCALAFFIGVFFIWFWELNPLILCNRYVVPLRFLYPIWYDAVKIVGWGGLIGWVLFLALV